MRRPCPANRKVSRSARRNRRLGSNRRDMGCVKSTPAGDQPEERPGPRGGPTVSPTIANRELVQVRDLSLAHDAPCPECTPPLHAASLTCSATRTSSAANDGGGGSGAGQPEPGTARHAPQGRPGACGARRPSSARAGEQGGSRHPGVKRSNLVAAIRDERGH